MPNFEWKQGDSGPAIFDTLAFGDGSIPPLQGANLTFRLRNLSNPDLLTLEGQAVIESPATGEVSFTPTTSDTSNDPGDYIAEWSVQLDGGTVLTFPTEGYIWGRIMPNAASAPQMIVPLPEFKAYLNKNPSDSSQDAKYMDAIQVVTPIIEDYIGPVVVRTFDEWYDGGSNIIELTNTPSSGFGTNPVMRLLAVSEYRGPIEYPLSIIPSPVYGSIYSVFLDPQMGTITRQSAGGATIAFMPGRNKIHVIYQAGQSPVPPNVKYAAKEAARVVYNWSLQTGSGSRAVADEQESGPNLQRDLTRLVRILLAPDRRAPSYA